MLNKYNNPALENYECENQMTIQEWMELTMSKADKEYTLRRQGMVYAYSKIKDNGLEDFAHEMQRRGLLKIDITVSDDEIQEVFNKMADNMINTMIPLFYSVLVDNFDFDKDKLHELHEKFKGEFNNIMDLDFLGEHYVTLEDYQKEMNERYGLDFDTKIGNECQTLADENSENFHYVKLETLIDRLERDRHPAAALYLKKMIQES